MLIVIKDIDEPIDLTDNLASSSICNILTAFREAKHIIVGRKDFFDSLQNHHEHYDVRTRHTASKISNLQREYRTLLEIVSFYIEIDFSHRGRLLKKQDNFGRDILSVSFDYFSDSSKIQIPKLLCEDLTDAAFYLFIADYFKKTNKMSFLDIKLSSQNGGGRNTENVFKSIIENGDLCLCILDSDKKHPTGTNGDTSNQFANKEYSANGKHIIIDVHEAENLIPNKIIEEVITQGNYPNEFINHIDNLRNLCNHHPESKRFFDHKEGLPINLAVDLDGRYGQFWLPIIDNIPRLRRNKCIISHNCNCEPKCKPLHGFGTNLLANTLIYLEQNRSTKIRENLNAPIEDFWNSLGKEIFSWGCSPQTKLRA